MGKLLIANIPKPASITRKSLTWLRRTFPDLARWLEILNVRADLSQAVLIESSGPNRVVVSIYTEDRYYAIGASPAEDFLSCMVYERRPAPGEYNQRCRDLADGRYEAATFARILADIVACELVLIRR